MKMNNRRVDLFLEDIEYNIREALDFTSEGKDMFFSSTKTQYAVEKAIENIGEAVKNLDDETKKIVPYEDWSAISRTRDYFVHHYFGIDTNLVWDIVQKDIPMLQIIINKIREVKRQEKIQAAKNPNTSQDDLIFLSKDTDAVIRKAVAENPSSSWDVLKELQWDSDKAIKEIANKRIMELPRRRMKM